MITIPTVADAVGEDDEDLGFYLSNPSGGATLAADSGYVIILDDSASPGSLQIAAAPVGIVQESASAVFVLTRTKGRRGAVSVRYFTTAISATAEAEQPGCSMRCCSRSHLHSRAAGQVNKRS